jgi:hypothetical protein
MSPQGALLEIHLPSPGEAGSSPEGPELPFLVGAQYLQSMLG